MHSLVFIFKTIYFVSTGISFPKLFENHSGYEDFVEGGTMEKPNVSHCIEENEVHYNPIPHDYSKDYLTFEILESGLIKWTLVGTSSYSPLTISYSKDNGENWVQVTSSSSGTPIEANKGDIILFKGNNQSYWATSHNDFRNTTCTFNVYGNVMSLINGDDFTESNVNFSDKAFQCLFIGCNAIDANNLKLPSTSLTQYCYANMFNSCTNLVKTPELLATNMAYSCYLGMFNNCANLTTAPILPATTLAYACYQDMFKNCIGIEIAPELPAITVSEYCYSGMFNGCTGLTTAPVLSATTLARYCYSNMFNGCASLNSITCLATDKSASNCTSSWVGGVASSGTFTKAANVSIWETGVHGVPEGWTVQDAS